MVLNNVVKFEDLQRDARENPEFILFAVYLDFLDSSEIISSLDHRQVRSDLWQNFQ